MLHNFSQMQQIRLFTVPVDTVRRHVLEDLEIKELSRLKVELLEKSSRPSLLITSDVYPVVTECDVHLSSELGKVDIIIAQRTQQIVDSFKIRK